MYRFEQRLLGLAFRGGSAKIVKDCLRWVERHDRVDGYGEIRYVAALNQGEMPDGFGD
jgi:hypothetical protein